MRASKDQRTRIAALVRQVRPTWRFEDIDRALRDASGMARDRDQLQGVALTAARDFTADDTPDVIVTGWDTYAAQSVATAQANRAARAAEDDDPTRHDGWRIAVDLGLDARVSRDQWRGMDGPQRVTALNTWCRTQPLDVARTERAVDLMVDVKAAHEEATIRAQQLGAAQAAAGRAWSTRNTTPTTTRSSA